MLIDSQKTPLQLHQPSGDNSPKHGKFPQSVSGVSAQWLPLTAAGLDGDWLGDKLSSARGIQLADKHLPLLRQTCFILVISQTRGKRAFWERITHQTTFVTWLGVHFSRKYVMISTLRVP